MQELKQLLDDKLGWLVNTTGAKHVSVKLDASQLARIMNALREAENKSPDLPRIDPRMLGQQEPRGTKRSPEEVAQRLAEMYEQTEELRRQFLSEEPRKKFLRNCAQIANIRTSGNATNQGEENVQGKKSAHRKVSEECD